MDGTVEPIVTNGETNDAVTSKEKQQNPVETQDITVKNISPTPPTIVSESPPLPEDTPSFSSGDSSIATHSSSGPVPIHSAHASCSSISQAMSASSYGSGHGSPGAGIVATGGVEKAADDEREDNENDDSSTTDDDHALHALESTDDIQDAMTKTALCTTLFSFTRANRVPLNYANTLSKAMCNDSQTLREYERVKLEVDTIEKEAAIAEAHRPPVTKSFFGRPKPSSAPGPVALAKQKTEEIMWTWVRGKMEALMRATQARTNNNNDGGGPTSTGFKAHYSNSTPNLAHLAASASFSTGQGGGGTLLHSGRPTSISTRPPLPLVQTAPTSRSNSIVAGMGVLLPPPTHSPSTPHSPSLVHSSSFAPYVPGHTPLWSNTTQSSPSGSGANTPQPQQPGQGGTGRYSPRRLWRTLFYSSGGSNNATPSIPVPSHPTPVATPTLPIPAVSPVLAAMALADASHFESFPRVDEVLGGLVRAELPKGMTKWMIGRSGENDPTETESPLVLHSECFTFPVVSPLNSFHLSSQELQLEQDWLGTWSDVLLNYRKHVPRSSASTSTITTTPQQILLAWFLTMWTRIERGAWTQVGKVDIIPPSHSPPLKESTPMELMAAPIPSATSNQSTPVVVSIHLATASPVVPNTPATETVLPNGGRISPFHIRLLLMLQHWLWLCPFDFLSDQVACVRVERFLKEQKEKYASSSKIAIGTAMPDASNPSSAVEDASDPIDVGREDNFTRFLSSLSDSLQFVASNTPSNSLAHPCLTPSPLIVLPYPFSEEIDSIYSSSLFSYPPVELARELMLHAHELFRRIPLHEWMDGAWQKHKRSGSGSTDTATPNAATREAYSNAYSLATQQRAASDGAIFAQQENSHATSTKNGEQAGRIASSAAATPTGSPTPSASPPTNSSSTSTATSLFIADFNRLVYWISTEILHPRLSPSQRQELVLYFLELAVVSLKVHRNFHVAFAVSAAFQTQQLYRLKEIQALSNMTGRFYHNQTAQVQQLVQLDLTPSATPNPAPSTPTNSASASTSNGRSLMTHDSPQPLVPPSASPIAAGTPRSSSSKKVRLPVSKQYEELRAVTSSRNNYACYRSIVSALLGESAGSSEHRQQKRSGDGWPGVSSEPQSTSSSAQSTPKLWPMDGSNVMGGTGGSFSRTSSAGDVAGLVTPSASQPVTFPSAQIDGLGGGGGSRLPDFPSLDSLPPLTLQHSITLVPHLAVHLKDLTYSQELSGVEKQWVEDQPAVPSIHDESDQSSVASTFQCRFDRSRWHRTTRLVCTLLRLQRLPVFSTLLASHSPPLYTLLQVHLLTHVLPESELLKISLEICPRVDKNKQAQTQKQQKTLSALQEEGFI